MNIIIYLKKVNKTWDSREMFYFSNSSNWVFNSMKLFSFFSYAYSN